jgi:hypothetical protein
MGSESVLSPEVDDDSLLDLAAAATGLDQPEVLVPAISGFDAAQEHDGTYPTPRTHESRGGFNGLFGDPETSVWHYILRESPDALLFFQWISRNRPFKEGKPVL